jgi:asparagine synthase (glutamine-hydrolysing)
MSALLGIFGPAVDRRIDAALRRRMLGRMRHRGADRTQLHGEPRAVLAVQRAAWELAPGFSGDVLLAREGPVTVAADASLYYRDDLRTALRALDVRPAADTPAHLILAAYQAWGADCALHLEGDFAFVLYDDAHDRVLAARDHGGKRPLFWAEVGDTLIVASGMGAILELPGVRSEVDPVALASAVSALTDPPDMTWNADIARLPAGWLLRRDAGGSATARRYWREPEITSFSRRRPHDAAEELRELIGRATIERLAPGATTALWMSGGYDSTAVYGGGRHALASASDPRTIQPVSVSYPPGDSGREDEYIESVLRHWRAEPHWIPIESVGDAAEVVLGAARRDEPRYFPFEPANRTLARHSLAVGSRVALDGYGGDQLFGASMHYLADLLRTGRWLSLHAEWRAGSQRGARSFFRSVIRPNLSPTAVRLATVLRGGRPLAEPPTLMRQPVTWLAPEFVRTHGLQERERALQPPVNGRDIAAYEYYWHLVCPDFPNFTTLMNGAVLEEGVEVRSPLYDRRIIDFMARQPVCERRSGGENKPLLRRSMLGLLPDDVLARRRYRTGMPRDYFARATRQLLSGPAARLLREPLLADISVVDATELGRAVNWALARPRGSQLDVYLSFTLHAELWLRARNAAPMPLHEVSDDRMVLAG